MIAKFIRMKEIELTQGKVALVDDEDYERVSSYTWYYGQDQALNDPLGNMHRFIMNSSKGTFIHHIDKDKLNNQKENIRVFSNRAEYAKCCISKGMFKKGHTPWHEGTKGQKIKPAWNKGRKFPEYSGENNPNWKGGLRSENNKIRRSDEYASWRTAVFKRDDYTCQACGQIGGELNADHIKSFAHFPALRLDISNGQTLCLSCHKLTPTYLKGPKNVKTCLLTGIGGFVGSNVLEYLLEHTDWKIIGVASWRHRGNPLNVGESKVYKKYRKRVSMYTHDLNSPIPPSLAVKIGAPDYIINLASISSVDYSIEFPVETIENNIAIVLNLLEYARKYKPEVFLQFSTDEVYGANSHNDWDILLPSNVYSASKACQELMCITYFKCYNIPVVITNSNNLVAKNQHKEKFLPKIIDLIKKEEMVTIHTSKGKPGERHYNPVANVSAALQFILEKTTPNTYPEQDRPSRFSLPGGDELSNLELAQLVADLMGKELKYTLVDAESIRPGYDAFYPRAEGSLLQELGFVPPCNLRDELEKLVKESC